MLAKNRRIQRKMFDTILKSGRKYFSDSFILYIAKFTQEEAGHPSKFSFSVSKKVSKLAVSRNRLRRRGYSVISKHIKRVGGGYFCFFVYKKGFKEEYSVVESEILGLLSTSGVII